jgi:hypothetical protein
MLATYSYSLVSLTSLLMGAIIFTGMVGTSQLILKQGEPIDIYGGFFIGFIAQAVALFFVFSL